MFSFFTGNRIGEGFWTISKIKIYRKMLAILCASSRCCTMCKQTGAQRSKRTKGHLKAHKKRSCSFAFPGRVIWFLLIFAAPFVAFCCLTIIGIWCIDKTVTRLLHLWFSKQFEIWKTFEFCNFINSDVKLNMFKIQRSTGRFTFLWSMIFIIFSQYRRAWRMKKNKTI